MQVAVLADTQAPRGDMSELQSLADGDHAVNEQQGQNVVERAEGPVLRGDMSELQSLADDGDHAANEQQGQNLVERAEGPARGDERLGLAGESEPQPGQDKLAALKTLRSTLRASLKRATQDFRNESRKRRRLLAKAGRLSQEDLLFLLRRQNA